VASYEIANQRRRQRRADQLQAEVELLQVRTVVADSFDSLPDLVAAAFDSLSPDDQEVLRLATWERLSLVEGAAVLGCSVSAYRMRLHRARLRLGKRVTQEQADARRDANDARFRTTTIEPFGLRVRGAEVAL
jgi:RNA polymerase sigma-70 factor (ECF subfamily)